MNFLQLCQRLRQECGGSGDGPTTTVNQAGESKQFIDWVNQAYLEIQEERRDWQWLWNEAQLQVTQGINTYSLASIYVVDDSMILNGRVLDRISFEDYREQSRMGLQTSIPTQWAMRPDGAIVFNALPESNGVLKYEYYRTPALLSGNEDTPRLPERFHMLIVYKAMTYYGYYENAPEVLQQGTRLFDAMSAKLSRDQLPQLLVAGPLA
jgi:hypothetical protein